VATGFGRNYKRCSSALPLILTLNFSPETTAWLSRARTRFPRKRASPQAVLYQAKSRRAEMAVSTCAKCSGHSFELALFTPLGESKKLTIVQCAQCGTPIGVLDPAAGPAMEALKNQIAAIDERLNRIAKALAD
jgi:hypothetical protein